MENLGESQSDSKNKWSDLFTKVSSWKDIISIPERDLAKRISDEIKGLERDDIKWKLTARKIYGAVFTALLFMQNYFIFWITYKAFHYDRLEQLSLVLGALVTGTLIETAFIIRIIVLWLFKDIDYSKKSN